MALRPAGSRRPAPDAVDGLRLALHTAAHFVEVEPERGPHTNRRELSFPVGPSNCVRANTDQLG